MYEDSGRPSNGGRFELYRVYSMVYTGDSKQCRRNEHQRASISVFLPFFLLLYLAEYDARI